MTAKADKFLRLLLHLAKRYVVKHVNNTMIAVPQCREACIHAAG